MTILEIQLVKCGSSVKQACLYLMIFIAFLIFCMFCARLMSRGCVELITGMFTYSLSVCLRVTIEPTWSYLHTLHTFMTIYIHPLVILNHKLRWFLILGEIME